MRRLALYVPASVRRSLRRIARQGPRNLMRRDASALERDVRYAVQVAESMFETISGLGLELPGLRVLELGPGHNFGPQLLLAGHGARMTLTDRFLAPWDETYHPAFYRALRARWTGPAPALDRVIGAGGYGDTLTLLAEPAERLSVADASFDLVLSNAVLEHVFDLPAVCREMARITRLDGVNLHQIDFRWHRAGFARPLGFLLQTEARFRRDFAGDHGECGNRWRASEVAALFRSAGFEVLRTAVTETADDQELARFLPKLRRSRSPYRTWPAEDLRILGARVELRRTGDPATRSRGEAEVEAQRKRKSEALVRLRHKIR